MRKICERMQQKGPAVGGRGLYFSRDGNYDAFRVADPEEET
jgi:hypothetical protein